MNLHGFLHAVLRGIGLPALVTLGLTANLGSYGEGGESWPDCGLYQFVEVRPASQPLHDGAGTNLLLVIEASDSSARDTAHALELALIGPATWERFDATANAWVSVASGPLNYQIDRLVFSRDDGAQYRAKVGLKCDPANRSRVNLNLESPVIGLQVMAGATAWVDATAPADATVPQGGTARFAVLAHGDNLYQWQVSSDLGVSWLDLAAASADTLQVPAIADGLQYRLRATNRHGGQQIFSRAATLSVTPVVGAPAITQQPADANIAAGDPAVFSVEATGGALEFQWQRADGGNLFTDVLGATRNVYSLTAQAADTGARLRVRVTNSAGSVTSAEALLTVTQPGVASITQQPANQTVLDGATVTFSVAAAGPSLAYQWQRSDDLGARYTDIPGANGPVYSLLASAAGNDDGARFRVIVGNALNTVTSDEAVLTLTLVAPVITQPPADLTVAAGGAARFSVAASGSLLRYQWQTCAANGTFADIGGATADSYGFIALLADSGRRFRVTIAGGTTVPVSSGCVTLTVNGSGLAITATPASLVLLEGSTANVDVRIHPISGQAGTVDLAARALPAGTPAALGFVPALPQSYATTGAADISQVLALTAGPFRAPFTFQLDASEGATKVSAPVQVTPLPAAAGSLQLGNAGVVTSTTTLERRGPEVIPATVPPTYTYWGRVDVARGELGLYLKAGALASLYIDFYPTALWLYNDTAAPVNLPAGAVRMKVEGSYALPAAATAVVDASLWLLVASATNARSTASVTGGVRHTNGPAGAAPAVTGTSNNALVDPPAVLDLNFGRTFLRAEIASPAITLPPGGNLRVSPRLRSYNPVTAGSTIDFMTVPTRLCLTLPPGVALASNSILPLNWTCP